MPVYIQHHVLKQLDDVFDAQAIWQAPGLALFNRKTQLRDLLERNPREHKGRSPTRCFHHVALMLPQEEVDDDYHLTRGSKAHDLALALRDLHQKDFGDLLGGEEVRYQIIGDEALEAGQIGIKFGHAVYLGGQDERLQYQVSSSTDSVVWSPVCALFANQRLALIAGDVCQASFRAPGWPFDGEGGILLVNDGANTPITVQVRPKEAFDCRFDAQHGYYVITARDGDADDARRPGRLLLKVARVGATAKAGPPAQHLARAPAKPAQSEAIARENPRTAPQEPLFHSEAPAPGQASAQAAKLGQQLQGVWKPRPANQSGQSGATAARDRPDRDQTALPQPTHLARPLNLADLAGEQTYAPVAQHRVSLVALMLPRLSGYRETGVEALQIGFTRDLQIAGAVPGSPNGGQVDAAKLAISFEANAFDQLYARTAAGRQRIDLPASFAPVDTEEIALLAIAPEMADRYCAALCLPHPFGVAVAPGVRQVFGRGMPALAQLRVLDSPRFLLRKANAEISSADRIGLSRNAFSFAAMADGFQIRREAESQTLYHLDDKLEFVGKIDALDADGEYLLPHGHHLVAGHYVLRFDSNGIVPLLRQSCGG